MVGLTQGLRQSCVLQVLVHAHLLYCAVLHVFMVLVKLERAGPQALLLVLVRNYASVVLDRV